jgi:hypothetical protein
MKHKAPAHGAGMVRFQQGLGIHCHSRILGKYQCLVATEARQGGRCDIGLQQNKTKQNTEMQDFRRQCCSQQREGEQNLPFSGSKSQHQNVIGGWDGVFQMFLSCLGATSKIRTLPSVSKEP